MNESNYYQAIGQVRGVYSEGELHIRQGFYPAAGVHKAKWGLKAIAQNPQELRFLVYPRFNMASQDLELRIVGWADYKGEPDEWKLAGLWQFIPQSPRPVLAIHRNQKKWDGDRLRSCYLPFVWSTPDALRPWRFKAHLSREDQGAPSFLSCTATLDSRYPRFFLKSVISCSPVAPYRERLSKEERRAGGVPALQAVTTPPRVEMAS